MKIWQRERLRKTQNELKVCEQHLINIQRLPSTRRNQELESNLQVKAKDLSSKISAVLCQKSRELWLKDGDSNSCLFHTSMMVRRKRNHIEGLPDDSDTWLKERDQIGMFLNSKFSELFRFSSSEFLKSLEIWSILSWVTKIMKISQRSLWGYKLKR